ncbi:hypothetical protein [Streptomyces yaizuensis]|uniref:Uncharacterized protein n=1 Tax=Streptomyces yaizuensis TaxID=2989713 RepID=A0AA86MCM6_9ACTN|nr:hypothetical protein [Streptomyces sp. YSPA8]BDT39472.1 hypothetical protein SYYSPA8_36770 [Streptomyces sp. YSPA8]
MDDEDDAGDGEAVACAPYCGCGNRYCAACPGCGDYMGDCNCPVTVYLLGGGTAEL